jgi:hypothetical protein
VLKYFFTKGGSLMFAMADVSKRGRRARAPTAALLAAGICALFVFVAQWAVGTCYHECRESTAICVGKWVPDANPAGWDVISAVFNPPVASVLWNPFGGVGTPDNFFWGEEKAQQKFVEYPAWPCACTPPSANVAGEVPSTGGFAPEGVFVQKQYYQYCNHCY